MTVSSETSRKTYSGDGVTTSFATSPMVFFDATDLTVYVVTTATGVVVATLVLNTNYTVSGGDGSTGTLDLSAGSSPYGAPASGTTLVIVREVPATQSSDLVNNDGSDAEVLEDALDRLTMILQQHKTQLDRSFTLADSDVSGASTEIPTPSGNKLIGWNSGATALENKAAADVSLTLVTAFVQTLLDDADGDAFWNTLETSITDWDLFVQDIFDGATAETSPAVGDLILLSDVSLTPDDGRKMTLENVLKVVNGLTQKTKPVRTTDFVSSYSAADSAARKVLLDDLPLPRSYLTGFGLSNNSGDATNDIDIAVGSCRSKDNTDNILLASALTKQLDATWAVGTNAGMRASGAAIANTTYHIFAIKRPDTGVVDIAADTSATGANIAANTDAAYTEIRRIGSILRESGAIVGFVQDGDLFQRKATILDVNVANPGITAVTRTLSVPVGINVRAMIGVSLSAATSAAGSSAYVSDLEVNDETSDRTLARANVVTETANEATGGPFFIRTNTSAQVRSRLSHSGASDTFRIATMGWLDTRGKDA